MKNPGLGLRTAHFNYLLKNPEIKIGWFEAITENFINTGGAPLFVLERLRERYPVSLHGVSLSIGSVDGVRREHLEKIKALADRIEPFQVSDHFCFSRFARRQYHELLPLPLTYAMARRVIRNIDTVQNFLKKELVLENISAYAEYPHNEMGEAEFINLVAGESGCKILLDINNIYVNAANFRFNARRFLKAIEPRHVAQYHLAGFTDLDTHLFDTHGEKIHAPVLTLYREALHHIGERPFSLERDDHIPSFAALRREALRVAGLSPKKMPARFAGQKPPVRANPDKIKKSSLVDETLWQKNIYSRRAKPSEKSAGTLTPQGVQQVYRNAYHTRLADALTEKFTRLREAAGDRLFARIQDRYVAEVASADEDLGEYGGRMPVFLEKQRLTRLAPHAKLDLVRYELFRLPAAAGTIDLFRQKVSFGPHARLLTRPYPLLLYRNGFAVGELKISTAEARFLSRFKKPVLISQILARAEAEKRLSPGQVKRLFRILGIPGILK